MFERGGGAADISRLCGILSTKKKKLVKALSDHLIQEGLMVDSSEEASEIMKEQM